MIGPKKLSAIYDELGAAIAAQDENPIVALDREIRKIKRKPKASRADLRSLTLVRNTLARAVKDKLSKPKRRRKQRVKGAV
jgi:hypothetical protein